MKCARCGFDYDLDKSKVVIRMIGSDGRTYSACSDCLCELGKAETEEEKRAILEEFAEGSKNERCN